MEIKKVRIRNPYTIISNGKVIWKNTEQIYDGAYDIRTGRFMVKIPINGEEIPVDIEIPDVEIVE